MGEIARGHDCRVEVTVNGEIQAAYLLATSWSYNVELNEDSRNYLNEASPRPSTTFNGHRLSLDYEPNSSDWQTLVELEIAKAKGDADALEKIVNVSFSTDHKRGDVMRRIMTNCRLTSPSISSPGRTEVQTGQASFMSGDCIPV